MIVTPPAICWTPGQWDHMEKPKCPEKAPAPAPSPSVVVVTITPTASPTGAPSAVAPTPTHDCGVRGEYCVRTVPGGYDTAGIHPVSPNAPAAYIVVIVLGVVLVWALATHRLDGFLDRARDAFMGGFRDGLDKVDPEDEQGDEEDEDWGEEDEDDDAHPHARVGLMDRLRGRTPHPSPKTAPGPSMTKPQVNRPSPLSEGAVRDEVRDAVRDALAELLAAQGAGPLRHPGNSNQFPAWTPNAPFDTSTETNYTSLEKVATPPDERVEQMVKWLKLGWPTEDIYAEGKTEFNVSRASLERSLSEARRQLGVEP